MLHCFYLHTRDVWTYINIHICKHVKTLPSRKLCSKLYECIRRDFRKQSLNPLRSACMRVCVCVCVCMHARVCVCVYVSWDVSICVLFMFYKCVCKVLMEFLLCLYIYIYIYIYNANVSEGENCFALFSAGQLKRKAL